MSRRNRMRRAILAAGLAITSHAAMGADPAPSIEMQAPVPGEPAVDALAPASPAAPHQRSGLDIYQRFRDGLADPECDSQATNGRWKKHFSHAPGQLASAQDDLLPLFGYVVDALRDAHLPTEFALIPFVESGYKPGARNPSGPAGLWQFIGITARNQGVPMREGYDGRLSPVDSTQAAVRYLRVHAAQLGIDPGRIAIGGHSAGSVTAFAVGYNDAFTGDNTDNLGPPHTVSAVMGMDGFTFRPTEPNDAPFTLFSAQLSQEEDNPDAIPNLLGQAQALGIPHDHHVVRGADHNDLIRRPYSRTIVAQAAPFLRQWFSCR